MTRLGIGALAALAVTWLAIALGAFSGDTDARAEREARQKAEQAASRADSTLKELRADHSAALDSLARLDSIYADSLEDAQQASEAAEAAASDRTRRLRETLTAQQQQQLDELTAFWSEALDEERRATRQALNRLRLAEARAAENMDLALAERDRGDSWREAYNAAEAEITALRKPDVNIFGLKFDLDCTAGPQAGYDALDRGASAGVGVTCGVNL